MVYGIVLHRQLKTWVALEKGSSIHAMVEVRIRRRARLKWFEPMRNRDFVFVGLEKKQRQETQISQLTKNKHVLKLQHQLTSAGS